MGLPRYKYLAVASPAEAFCPKLHSLNARYLALFTFSIYKPCLSSRVAVVRLAKRSCSNPDISPQIGKLIAQGDPNSFDSQHPSRLWIRLNGYENPEHQTTCFATIREYRSLAISIHNGDVTQHVFLQA